MSSEQLNRTAVKDARLKDLLLERGTRLFVRCVCTGWAAASSVPGLPERNPTYSPAGSESARLQSCGAQGRLSWPGREPVCGGGFRVTAQMLLLV